MEQGYRDKIHDEHGMRHYLQRAPLAKGDKRKPESQLRHEYRRYVVAMRLGNIPIGVSVFWGRTDGWGEFLVVGKDPIDVGDS